VQECCERHADQGELPPAKNAVRIAHHTDSQEAEKEMRAECLQRRLAEQY
jgi:hypothetical protein